MRERERATKYNAVEKKRKKERKRMNHLNACKTMPERILAPF